MIQVGNLCKCMRGKLGIVVFNRGGVYYGYHVEDHRDFDDKYQLCITERNWASENPTLVAESIEDYIV